MSELSSPEILLPAILLVVAGVVAVYVWMRNRRQSPQERERLRRLTVNVKGRLADGELLDGPETPPAGNLLYYKYRACGVEYTAAQDISALNGIAGTHRPGDTISVKYDPREPANSIVVCEEWNGLHSERQSFRSTE